ncbi:ORF385 [White spot syndrome virus]|uniref:ORF385 n=1 Tax=White spot syndrome virus TaxID=342409 RepID=A0A2D3I5T1_9VIRU|nr:ORF385 [White spot syndrome virus]
MARNSSKDLTLTSLTSKIQQSNKSFEEARTESAAFTKTSLAIRFITFPTRFSYISLLFSLFLSAKEETLTKFLTSERGLERSLLRRPIRT